MSEKIREYIYSSKNDFLETLSELVAIPSVKGAPEQNAPFGKEPRRALDRMLAVCEASGFETRCVKGAVGTAEYPPKTGAALGILCHLDVVPADAESWSSDPFTLTEREGVLYGRGVIDDKGPAVAALFALKCVKELGIPLKKGVRLIFGTDEENGSEDLKLYRAEETLPEAVFTPDGSFPVINIEKGMMRSRFVGTFDGGSITEFSGGKIPNAVPDKAYAAVDISPEKIMRVIAADKSGAEFALEKKKGGVVIRCFGKAAHASTPEDGINAVTALISLLNRLPLKEGKQREILRGLERIFPFGETDGEHAGLKCRDEKSGALTCVFSIFEMNENGCRGTVDVRFPTCADLAFVERTERKAFESAGCEFEGSMGDEPHCTDENSEFVKTLLRVYERVEGEKGCCLAIGGGTYVHNIEGGVAFGAERGSKDYRMHGADERADTDELLRDAVLFAEVIAEICG